MPGFYVLRVILHIFDAFGVEVLEDWFRVLRDRRMEGLMGRTGDVGSCIFCFYFGIALPEGVAWDLLMCLLFRDEAC